MYISKFITTLLLYDEILTWFCQNPMLSNKIKNFIILLNIMRFKMNVAKYIVAIFTIVGISGLLYTSIFLPSVFAQNTPDGDTGAQQQGGQEQSAQQPGAGTFEELQNLTQGNKDLLANNSAISNTSLSTGLELEQDTDQPNATAATQETDQQQADHAPQGQIGPALDPSAAPQQNQTEQQQPAGGQQEGQQQNQTGQPAGGQQQQQQNQSKGPLDQILEPFKGLLGGGQ